MREGGLDLVCENCETGQTIQTHTCRSDKVKNKKIK